MLFEVKIQFWIFLGNCFWWQNILVRIFFFVDCAIFLVLFEGFCWRPFGCFKNFPKKSKTEFSLQKTFSLQKASKRSSTKPFKKNPYNITHNLQKKKILTKIFCHQKKFPKKSKTEFSLQKASKRSSTKPFKKNPYNITHNLQKNNNENEK